MKNKQKIESFLEKEIIDSIAKISIIKSNDCYILFGKYEIDKHQDLYRVNYINYFDSILFSNLKSAVTWCIYHSKGKLSECREIEHLDFKIASIIIDITQTQMLINKTSLREIRHIYTTKLEEYILKKQYLLTRINYYMDVASKWQKESLKLAKIDK